jgi:hypothetical protein
MVRVIDHQSAQQIRIEAMTSRRLRCVGPAMDRFDPHSPHQCADMMPADLAAFGGQQQATQNPRTCERELQMQLIEPPHQRKVCIRHRRRFVVDAAQAGAEERRLLRQRKPVVAVDHRFALGNPALPSARSKKSFSSTSSPILACSDLTSTSDAEDLRLPPCSNSPARSCSFHELI